MFSVKDKQYPVVMYVCLSIKAFNCKCELKVIFLTTGVLDSTGVFLICAMQVCFF